MVGFSTSDGWSAQVGDFNGDGADDLFSVGNNGTAWISTATDTTGGTDIDSVPDHFVNTQWTEWIGGQATWRVGDFSGDGRSDAGEVYDADTTSALDHRWQAWLMNPRVTSSYAYDDTDQLTAANHTGQTDQADESYAYDENGNPTGTGYTIGTGNRILADATHDYAYDAEGNLTRETERASGNYRQYAYDHRNQLVAVSFYTAANVLTKKVEYDYDVSNRLIRRRVDETNDGVFDSAQRFVYDNAGKFDPATGVPLDDIALVFDETGSLTTRRLHGPAIDQVFADEDALGEILWSLTDRQGTVRDVADYDATTDITSIVNHLTYDSFGELTDQTDPTKSPLGKWTGRYRDPITGDQWHNGRWYHPRLRRWLQQDPSGLEPDPNPYRPVGNSPTNYIDPSGLFQLFGQNFVMPWHPNAGGFSDTMSAYGNAAVVAAAGTASGAIAGAGTGAIAGAVVGSAGGATAVPGAIAGAGAGALGGGIAGFITAMVSDTAGEAAVNGALTGAISGLAPGAVAGYSATVGAAGGTAGATLAPASAGGAGGTVIAASPAAINNAGIAAGVGIGILGAPNEGQFYCEGEASGRDPAQDKLLSKGEIKKLKDAGEDVHALKGGRGASKYDLYKDYEGSIYVKPKGGSGPGDPLHININDY